MLLMRVNEKENEEINTELNRLTESATESGSQAGLYGLPDDFVAITDSSLRVLATKQFGELGPDPDVVLQQEVELDRYRQEAEEKVRVYRAKYEARSSLDAPSNGTPAANWRRAFSVAIAASIVGLCFEVCGTALGWQGWLALGLAALLLMLNVSVLLGMARHWIARFRDFLVYRRALSQASKMTKRIWQIRISRLQEIERRNLMAHWIADNSRMILSHYQYHKSRGVCAAQQINPLLTHSIKEEAVWR